MATPKTEIAAVDAVETSIIHIDMNRSMEVPLPSPGLSELLVRVDKFLVIPDENRMKPMELNKARKAKHEQAVAEVAKLLPITDDESFKSVLAFAKEATNIRASIVAAWEGLKTKAHDAHAAICARESKELAAKDVICDAVKLNGIAYRSEQDRQKLEREREAQRIADNERLRLLQAERAKEQERLRLENEAKEARRQGDMRRAKEVTAQVAAVNQQIAQVQEEAAAVTEEVVHAPAAKVEGVGERRPWSGECYDANLLMKAIVEGRFPLMHLVPQRGGPDKMVPVLEVNQAVLDHYAKRQQDSMAIPGCRAVQGFGLSVKKG